MKHWKRLVFSHSYVRESESERRIFFYTLSLVGIFVSKWDQEIFLKAILACKLDQWTLGKCCKQVWSATGCSFMQVWTFSFRFWRTKVKGSWRDVPFSGICVAALCRCGLLHSDSEGLRWRNLAGMCLFRHLCCNSCRCWHYLPILKNSKWRSHDGICLSETFAYSWVDWSWYFWRPKVFFSGRFDPGGSPPTKKFTYAPWRHFMMGDKVMSELIHYFI